jgi:hypothetical protein
VKQKSASACDDLALVTEAQRRIADGLGAACRMLAALGHRELAAEVDVLAARVLEALQEGRS